VGTTIEQQKQELCAEVWEWEGKDAEALVASIYKVLGIIRPDMGKTLREWRRGVQLAMDEIRLLRDQGKTLRRRIEDLENELEEGRDENVLRNRFGNG